MHLQAGKGEFASPQYPQPCTMVLIDEMVAEINENIEISPRDIEITKEITSEGYDNAEQGTLTEIYLEGKDLYLFGPNLAICPIDVWELQLSYVVRFRSL